MMHWFCEWGFPSTRQSQRIVHPLRYYSFPLENLLHAATSSTIWMMSHAPDAFNARERELEGLLQYEGRRKDGSKLGNLSCSQPSKLCKNFGKISRLLVYFSKHLVVPARGFPSQTARIRGGPFSWIGSLHFCQVSTQQAKAIKSDSLPHCETQM